MRYLASLLFVSLFASAINADPYLFAVKGEAIFFKSSLDDTIFATATSPSTGGLFVTYREIDPQYRTGFRVAGLWRYDCGHDVQVRYTHSNSGNYRESFNGSFLEAGFPLAGAAKSRLNLKYNAVDALLGTWIFNSRDFDLNFAAGVHYANIRLYHIGDYGPFEIPPTSITDERRARFWGIGPEVCFDFHYLFSSCFVGNFCLTGYAKGALLSSRTQEEVDLTVVGGLSGFISSQPKWSVIPAADFRLGLDWDFSCDCLNGSIEAGYEWIWYRKAIRHAILPVQAPPNYSDVSFQGPYLSVGMIF
jgi:hypothetical protein